VVQFAFVHIVPRRFLLYVDNWLCNSQYFLIEWMQMLAHFFINLKDISNLQKLHIPMFKKLFASIGFGGATVDTRLLKSQVALYDTVQGEIIVRGGSTEQDIEHLTLAVMTRMEVESGDSETTSDKVLQHIPIKGRFTLYEAQEMVIPFSFQLHPETPVSYLEPLGLSRHKTSVWIHTDLGIEWATDAADKDYLQVMPTPAMQYFHQAMTQLGYKLHAADVEKGNLKGTTFQSSLGCYQELEYKAGWGSGLNYKDLEVSFVTMPHQTGVLIEADRSWRGDLFRSIIMPNDRLASINWTSELQKSLA
jgi:sporulation-control protein